MTGRPFTQANQPHHDRAAAGRKGKARSPWSKGMPWLSGCGDDKARIKTARKRERIEQERYPGALMRPAFRLANED